MHWTAAFRALLKGEGWGGHIDHRSPAHIISAATRKANALKERRDTTNAMRAYLGLEGRV